MSVFGQNDFALRLPMIIIHLLSTILIFDISKKYMIDRNRLWLVLIFILLPGVLSSALLIDEAGLIIFGLLLFIWMFLKSKKLNYYLLLMFFSFLDNNFIYLFLSLSIYSIYVKDKEFFILNMFLFFISIFSFGIEAHGMPEGHFLDSLGLYSAIFSPIVYIYIVFALYRKYLSKELDILWFVAVIPFIISLLLSFRQTIHVEHFAPYLIISLPIVAKIFISSYRVRLKTFRTKYRAMFVLSFIFLAINTITVIFNKDLYRFINTPQKHFVHKFHVAKELAHELKMKSINCIDADYKMQQRLYFYGVTKCDNYILTPNIVELSKSNSVTISYRNKSIYKAYVTEINN